MATVLFVDPLGELKIKTCGEKGNAFCMQTPGNHVERVHKYFLRVNICFYWPQISYICRDQCNLRLKEMPIKRQNETKMSRAFLC